MPQRAEVIQFATCDCSLGTLLVAVSEKGICAILIGDAADALARDLHRRFPKANLIAASQALAPAVAEVLRLVESPCLRLSLPLDVRGTEFQRSVWKILQEIPPASTASYSEVARRVGKPDAVRAVATACGANTHAVAIPCHRVLRTGGAISGYRWGIERKKALLTREANAA